MALTIMSLTLLLLKRRAFTEPERQKIHVNIFLAGVGF